MAAIISGSDLTTFGNLNNLEQQCVFLAAKLMTVQNTYNINNPTTPKNAVAIVPNYAQRTLTMQFALTIEGDAALQNLHDNITAVIP